MYIPSIVILPLDPGKTLLGVDEISGGLDGCSRHNTAPLLRKNAHTQQVLAMSESQRCARVHSQHCHANRATETC